MKNIKPAIESEIAVLGGLLLNSDLFTEVSNIICPQDFCDKRHEEIFNCMRKLFNKHKYFDIPMIGDTLDFDKRERILLYRMAEECASTANIKAYAEIIREKSVQCKLINMSSTRFTPSDAERREMCAIYLEELAVEIRTIKLDYYYLADVLMTISRELVDLYDFVDEEEV